MNSSRRRKGAGKPARRQVFFGEMAVRADEQRVRDGILVARYSDGDPSAARELTARHAPRILRLATHMLGNAAEAEEVTQETMLRLWIIAPDWQPGRATVSTWVWKVALNLCTDILRRRRGVAFDDIEEPRDETPGALDQLMRRNRARSLQDALARLPERQRLAVILRHLEGASNPQIADVLGTSVEAVESLLSRGIRGLKSDLLPQKEALGWQN